MDRKPILPDWAIASVHRKSNEFSQVPIADVCTIASEAATLELPADRWADWDGLIDTPNSLITACCVAAQELGMHFHTVAELVAACHVTRWYLHGPGSMADRVALGPAEALEAALNHSAKLGRVIQ